MVSKTPKANHRRPLPLWKRLWPNVEARPAKLSDHLFPESVWKAFGAHVGILMVILAAWRPC
eukprot:5563161-Pyramimonas_sp.AAC.1